MDDCGDWLDARDLSFRLERVVDSMAMCDDLSPHLSTVVSFASGVSDRESIECLVAACRRRCSKKPVSSTASEPVGLFEAIPHLLLERSSSSLMLFHDRLTGENLAGFYSLVWLVTLIESVIDGDGEKVEGLVRVSEQVSGDLTPILRFVGSIDIQSGSVNRGTCAANNACRTNGNQASLIY